MPEITIIIPVFNNLELTRQCIESIYKLTDHQIFNILVINNGSTDGTLKYLESLALKYPNFSLINNCKNLGYARANNQGVKKAVTKFVLLLNNDTLVTKNWLNVLYNQLISDTQIKITGAKLLYEDNTIQHAGIVFSDFKNAGNNIIYHLYRFFPADHPAVNKKRYFQALTGACLLMEKEFFLENGGFNENYTNGFEDIDFCLKANEKGAKILYCPESMVYHFEAKSKGRFEHTEQNSTLFYSSWTSKLKQDDTGYYEEDGFILNKVAIESEIVETVQIGNQLASLNKEIINIIFEKDFANPELAIFLKPSAAEIREFILKLQINSTVSFRLFLIPGETVQYKNIQDFKNITVLNNETLTLADLKRFIEKQEMDHFVFLSGNEHLEFQWDKNFITFAKVFILNKLEALITQKVEEDDLPLLESLFGFFPTVVEIMFLMVDIYRLKSNYSRAIFLLTEFFKKSPGDKKIIEKLIICLTETGDHKTAEKFKGLLQNYPKD